MRTILLGAVVEPLDAKTELARILTRWPENASGERLALVVGIERRDGDLWLTLRGCTGLLLEVPASDVIVKKLR